ncbi:uncharacterized protein ACOB7L_001250 [Callospermophilus lateralis]|uniref:uncharacterized protein LOC143383014 n=1 Tax=Callospermophilus lateralis TaxID=76772 RepID=UPI004038621C
METSQTFLSIAIPDLPALLELVTWTHLAAGQSWQVDARLPSLLRWRGQKKQKGEEWALMLSLFFPDADSLSSCPLGTSVICGRMNKMKESYITDSQSLMLLHWLLSQEGALLLLSEERSS